MLTNGIIKKRVMEIIKSKITQAQQELDQESARLDAEHIRKVEMLSDELVVTKEKLVETQVAEVFLRILSGAGVPNK